MLILSSCINNDREKLDLLLEANEFLEDQDFNQAITIYSQAIQLDPEFTDAYNNRGVAFFENGKAALALADYNQALSLKPDYAEALFNRSNALVALGRIEDALKDLNNLRNYYGDSTIIDFSTGLAYFNNGNYLKSIEAFKTSWIKDPANVEIPINIGTAHYYLENFDSSQFYLIKAIQIDSDHPSSYGTLAMIEVKKQNLDSALYLIDKALDLAPDDPYFLNNRGYIFLLQGSLAQSIADINNSIITDPYNGWAYRNKGLYYLKLNNIDDAIKMLEKAAEMDVTIENVFLNLGEAYYKHGDVEKACEAWKSKYVKVLPKEYSTRCNE